MDNCSISKKDTVNSNFKIIGEILEKFLSFKKYFQKCPILIVKLSSKNRISFIIKDLIDLAPHSKLIKIKNQKNFFKEYIHFKKNREKKTIIYIETKKKKAGMWLMNFSNGPLVQISFVDIASCKKFNFFGNCNKWSIPLLSFDKSFLYQPHLSLVKKIFIQFFSSKRYDTRAEILLDHVISFCFYNSKIWIRVYQINYKKKKIKDNVHFEQLIEIGPRLVLQLQRIWADLKRKNLIYDSTILKKHYQKNYTKF